jgi:site-specific DNA-methyltransferase (adenine-specific)
MDRQENAIFLGDCLEILKKLPDTSVDSIITDPPYGLGNREPEVSEIIAYLQGSDLDTGGDFMGRDWHIPSIAIWKECFRVLKPGGHLLSFAGTRTFDLISLGIRAAGFENRDTIASQFGGTTLQWIYGSGFPKSLNIGKMIDKIAGMERKIIGQKWADRYPHGPGGVGFHGGPGNYTQIGRGPEMETAPATEEAKQWEGWGTALKPAWEPILVFRKPLEGIVVQNVLKHGTGGINVDGCRIGINSGDGTIGAQGIYGSGRVTRYTVPSGRWPANLVFTHSESCKIIGTKKVQAPTINRFDDGMKPFGHGAGHPYSTEPRGDEDGMEEIPIYECVDGCPVKILDEQSGVLTSGYLDTKKIRIEGTIYGKKLGNRDRIYLPNSGGASRFFGQFQLDAPFLYTSKVSRKERDGWATDPGHVNPHPTMKPLALMEWLVKLVTPKEAIVLDPFCGTGTTCIAALLSGCKFIGIEKDPVFHEIAIKRLEGMQPVIQAKVDDEIQQENFNMMFELEEE